MKTIAAIGTHCDDLEVLCGGSMAKLVKLGYKVIYAITTNTSFYYPSDKEVSSGKFRSNNEINELRKDEAREAARILGITETHFMDFKSLYWYPESREPGGLDRLQYLDGINSTVDDFRYLKESIKGREIFVTAHRTPGGLSYVCDFLKSNNVDTIFTNTPDDLHWEHSLNAGLITFAVFKLFEEDNIKIDVYALEHGNAGKMLQYDTPTHYMDITDTMDLKLESLKCFKSQSQDHSFTSVISLVRKRAENWGGIVGKKYAEVFTKMIIEPDQWEQINVPQGYDSSKIKDIL
ncbi:MAG: PIG-L family deacetylase [bacterium]